MAYTKEERDRLKGYEVVHLRGIDQDLPPGKRIGFLKKKDRNKGLMILLNVLAILFFSYSWHYEITTLGNTVYTVLVVVFAINILLILLQKRQIRELIAYYNSQA